MKLPSPTLVRVLSVLMAVSISIVGVPNRAAADPEPNEIAQSLSSAFERVAGIVTPSVVNVISTKKLKTPGRRQKQSRDPFFDPFRDFFGDDFFNAPPNQGGGGQDDFGQQGLGTGVIVDARGYILTNNHVVGEAEDITVRLHDQSSFKAEVIGRDPKTDLAVIKIKAKELAPAKLGNSDELKIGEWVVAAGNPFGLDNSITAGIVSAKGRSIMGGGQFEDFIQTDAAINPGNSGGPLLNLKGEVVGINTAIFSRSGGYMGIGFAIPISMAKNVMDSLIAKGKVVRGWLGVGIQNLTDELARSFNYPGVEGALVGHIQPKSPAEKAGLKQGDIVVAYNGEKIVNVNQFRNLVAATAPEASATLDIIREGRKSAVTVKVGELPAESDPEDQVIEEEENAPSLDIKVENLTPDLARRMRISRTHGVIVTSVAPGGLGADAGIAPHDIILTVDGKEIQDVKEFRALITKKAIANGIRLVVESQGMQRYVFVKSGD